MGIEGPEKRKKLILSMVILAGVVVGAGLATSAITGYFKAQDPVYDCIVNPETQPFQISVPITVMTDGIPSLVPEKIGFEEDGCIRPVHTLEEGIIHVAYGEPHPFTLGHFLYYWQVDLSKFDTKVYVDDAEHTEGSFLDIVLQDGMPIRIEFTSRG